MKIIVSPNTVKRIASKIKTLVNSLNEDIRLTDAHLVAARAFGYDNYQLLTNS